VFSSSVFLLFRNKRITRDMIGRMNEMKNQNQKFLPMLLANMPATICGISITQARRISGIILT